jgi:hypothetical protein
MDEHSERKYQHLEQLKKRFPPDGGARGYELEMELKQIRPSKSHPTYSSFMAVRNMKGLNKDNDPKEKKYQHLKKLKERFPPVGGARGYELEKELTGEYPSLLSVPSLVQRDTVKPKIKKDQKSVRQYDVFISYASEDRDDVVNALAQALKNNNLKIWYDEFELNIGDSIRSKIDKGLSNSSFGVVVISKFFIQKNWTNYELNGLVSREMTGEQILLPIWHNITQKEVIKYSPSLADKLARSTATHTVDKIAEEIAYVIKKSVNNEDAKKRK